MEGVMQDNVESSIGGAANSGGTVHTDGSSAYIRWEMKTESC